MKKSEVLFGLRTRVVEIEFVKADDSIRKMKATLEPSYLPVPLVIPIPDKPRKHNPDIQSVWDVEAKSFRSFRWDSLQTVSGETYLGE